LTPSFRPGLPRDSFADFVSFTPAEVATAITRLPDKSSVADPLPVLVLKGVADLLAPFLMHLFVQSFDSRRLFPTCFKDALVTPI
jgi:hypothetical protein